MAEFAAVPVLDVQKDNFKELWPTLLLALKTATFVAIDTELSGLGDRKKLNSRCVDDRYKAISETAQTRSILSLGISCFKLKPTSLQVNAAYNHPTNIDINTNEEAEDSSAKKKTPVSKALVFVVQTFNITLLCSEEYVVEPASLRFLVDHGFDFNRQYAQGISYYRGNDMEMKEYQTIRQLFMELLASRVPLIFHNAFVDLVFLYASFYASLPNTLASFLASLTAAFHGGIYDTKYITEFHARMTASFLEYVFRKSQREDAARAIRGLTYVKISFLSYPDDYASLNYLPCQPCQPSAQPHVNICQQFAGYGYCPHGKSCPLSHDVDLVLDNEHCVVEKKRRRRRRKRKCDDDRGTGVDPKAAEQREDETESGHGISHEGLGATSNDVEDEPDEGSTQEVSPESHTEIRHEISEDDCSTKNALNTLPSRTRGHRAGFDAFMTGYVFAHYLSEYGDLGACQEGKALSELGVSEFRNKVSLGGKDHPLHISHSNFAKLSKDHIVKMEKITLKTYQNETGAY